MIARPHCLLRLYSDFTPIAVDNVNVINAAASLDKRSGTLERVRRWLPTVRIDLGEVVKLIATSYGLPVPELERLATVEWGPQRENKLSAPGGIDEAARVNIHTGMVAFQSKLLRERDAYRHNVGYLQLPRPVIKSESKSTRELDTTLLLCPVSNAQPLYPPQPATGAPMPAHGDILVIDALLRASAETPGQWELSDYPPFLRKPDDTHLPLRLTQQAAELLGERLKTGDWNPYCRILGRYCALDEPKDVFEPLLISLREAHAARDTIVRELDAEWEELGGEAFAEMVRRDPLRVEIKAYLQFHRQLMIQKGEPPEIPDDALLDRLKEDIQKETFWADAKGPFTSFENNIFDGAAAFWLGLMYFALARRGDRSTVAGAQRGLRDRLNPFAGPEWNSQLRSFRSLDALRIDQSAWRTLLGLQD